MSPKRLKNGMKPSLFTVQISTILPGGFAPPEPPSFWGPQSAAPKPLPRLFLDPSYGPDIASLDVETMCVLYCTLLYVHIVINVNAPEGPGLVKLNEIKKINMNRKKMSLTPHA